MQRLNATSLPRLFCKPTDRTCVVYYSEASCLEGLLSFTSLDLSRDLPEIHRWVNMAYTKTFWQMGGPYQRLLAIYTRILEQPDAHSFVVYYQDRLVALVDVYRVAADELAYHIPGEEKHCGFHLLMAPYEKPIRGLTGAVIQGFLRYYFSFAEAEKIFAEPDIRNQKSIALLKEARFRLMKTVVLSYKTAYLYGLTKADFINS